MSANIEKKKKKKKKKKQKKPKNTPNPHSPRTPSTSPSTSAPTPTPNNFHWAFYHHTPETHHGGGTKYEVTNPGSSEVGGWIASHELASAIFQDAFLCVLIRIADAPEGKGGVLEEIMRERDAGLNESRELRVGFGC
ncbi:uncharacterized protein ASPGLDRAFT_1346976 [Aspergillus glaucus CBS 516.65]|uniref:Uncharacterized protein n=1 Tax=Aspergillus glaucus CBS 516.65 TaxID=1160497 RepID=A0A1L9VND5_ASPGL|nr:hypothetical protein ASPGLDRAFT_1346976 [Aspergillus glaucus CBS 516.65]OJJ85404.1 hypothetical protein ASPGLDRAFT_1346976 [Aspergillus glaucus CBS 516.65]